MVLRRRQFVPDGTSRCFVLYYASCRALEVHIGTIWYGVHLAGDFYRFAFDGSAVGLARPMASQREERADSVLLLFYW